MKRQRSGLSQLIKLSVLFLSAIGAHEIAGGSFLPLRLLLIQGSLIGAALIITRNRSVEGPALAVLALLTQSAGHMVLGGGDKSDEIGMTISHLLAGVMAFQLITHLERVIDFLSSILNKLFKAPQFRVFTQEIDFVNAINRQPASSTQCFYLNSHQLRAPPISEENL